MICDHNIAQTGTNKPPRTRSKAPASGLSSLLVGFETTLNLSKHLDDPLLFRCGAKSIFVGKGANFPPFRTSGQALAPLAPRTWPRKPTRAWMGLASKFSFETGGTLLMFGPEPDLSGLVFLSYPSGPRKHCPRPLFRTIPSLQLLLKASHDLDEVPRVFCQCGTGVPCH